MKNNIFFFSFFINAFEKLCTSGKGIWVFLLLITCASYGQVVNKGVLTVKDGSVLSVYSDYKNDEQSKLLNDGELFLYKNWDNNGEVVHDASLEGTVYFAGLEKQVITGTKASDFNNVVFDNVSDAAPFYLESKVSVSKAVYFENGVLNSDDMGGDFALGPQSMVVKASDKSFVDGMVSVDGNVEYDLIPIGDDGVYSPVSYRDSVGLELNATSKYYRENPVNKFGGLDGGKVDGRVSNIEVLDEDEYWEFHNNGNEDLEGNFFITLPMSGVSAREFNENVEGVQVLRWDEDAQVWRNYSSVVDVETQKVTALVPKGGFFTLGVAGGNALPCGGLEIYNAVTPNNDGANDFFKVAFKDGVDVCSAVQGTMHVEIYNRWGVKVFETDNYGSALGEDVFTGISEGRATIAPQDGLPSGTYYYILRFVYDAGFGTMKQYDKAGYLHLSGNE